MAWKSIKYNIKLKEIYRYLFLLLVFMMPLRMQVLPHIMLALTVSWLFSKNLKANFISAFKDKTYQIILLFVGLHVLGLIYTSNIIEGLKTLEIRVAFVIIPLIVYANKELFKKNIDRIISAFIWGNVIASLFCFILALIKAYNNAANDELFNFAVYSVHRDRSFFKLITSGYSYLNYTYFSVLIHANYFSMYITLSLYMVYRQILHVFYTKHKIDFFKINILLFLIIVIILLQSRAAILALIFLILYETIYNFTQPGYSKLKIIVSVVLISISIIFLTKSERFGRIFRTKNEVNYEQLKSNNLRLQIWEEALPLIKKNWFLGSGTGDLNDEFKEVYSENLYKLGGKKYLNFHNEFLETWGRNGILAFITLLYLLFSPLFYKLNYKYNREIVVLSIILIINFMFESMLVRLNGVLFFAIFYSLFNLRDNNNLIASKLD